MAASFYHKETGLLHSNHLTVSDEAAIALNTPPDHIAIDGHHDPLSKRVDVATGEIVDYQPPHPSEQHEWDATTKRWQLSAAAQAKAQARVAAAARIAALEASQHSLVRALVLGDESARPQLQAIADEISKLSFDHPARVLIPAGNAA